MAGLTPAGLEVETLETLVASIAADLHTEIDPALDVGAETPLGQIVTIFSDRLASAWEALALLYRAIDPNQAEGFLLDIIGSLRGIPRRQARNSTVLAMIQITGGPGTIVPAGFTVSDVDQTVRWLLVDPFTAPSNGFYELTFHSEEAGPFTALSGTLTEVVTPVAGVNNFGNGDDATPGQLAETDPNYRVRMELALAQPGSSTVDAIRSALLAEGPTSISDLAVYENTADTSTLIGSTYLPGHSILVLMRSPDFGTTEFNNAVAQIIWNNRPAGIETVGDEEGTAVDSEGLSRTVLFDEPTEISIYFDIQITVNSRFPTGGAGETAVKERLVSYLSSVTTTGTDVVALQGRSCLLEVNGGVPGVVDVPVFYQDPGTFGANPLNITINPDRIATFNTANVLVTVV